MTSSDLPNKDETDLQMQKRIAELERANQDLRAEILEYKKANETLSRDRSLLESVMQTTDIMLAFFDPQFNFVWVNPTYAESCHMKPEKIVGKNHFTLYPQEENEAIFRKVRDTGEGVFYKDKSFVYPDQPERGVTYWDWSLVPVKNSDGNVTGLVLSLRETTKYKQAEEALREAYEEIQAQTEEQQAANKELHVQSEELQAQTEELVEAYEALSESEKRYRLLFDHSLDAIILTDPQDDGKVLSANPAACQMLGWSEKELIGKGRNVMFDPEDPVLSTLLDERTRSGSAKVQLTYRRKDGTKFIGELSTALYTDINGEPRAVAIIRNITERKQLEEKTRQRAEELETIMEVVPTPILIGHDPQGHNITGNRMANEFYEAETGENISARIPKGRRFFYKDRELSADELPVQKAALKDINLRDIELDVFLPSGKLRAIMISASPLHDAKGHVRGSVGAFIDITERKEAEAKLKQTLDSLEETVKERTSELEKAYISLKDSEKGLAEAQKIAHLGNWEWNIKTDKINWSEETYHIFGRNPQEFGANYEASLSYIHPDDRLSVNNAVIEALNGKRYNIEFRIILANGENRVVHAKGETSFDENNTPVRLFGTVQDITDRKRTEEALRESEERFNLAVKAAQEGVWDWNMETDEVWYSSRYKEMLGYSDEEIEHHVSACLRLLHPDDKERSLQLVNAVMRGERNYELEFRLRHKDGHYLNILSRGYPVRRESDGKIVRIVGIHLDLTERKIAEEKLRESEEKYRNIVETANESICLINSEGVLTYVNKKMADMTGYTIGEIIGRTIWDFVGKEDQSTVTMNMEKRRRGISESYEIKLIRKDGSPFWVHVNVKE